MDRTQRLTIEAIGEVVRDRLSKMEPGAVRYETSIAPPKVDNHNHVDTDPIAEALRNIPAPDMTPVAEALDRMTDALTNQGKQISKLIDTLLNQKPPQVKAEPKTEISVAPQVQAVLGQEVMVLLSKVLHEIQNPPKRKKRLVKDKSGEPIGFDEV